MGNGSSRREVNALSRAQRRAVLGGEVNAAAIARRIKEGRSTKIVVLAGAGISCSAGELTCRLRLALSEQRASIEGDLPCANTLALARPIPA
jgi:phosphosulfolactate phosphohydrolase-like enzyme